MTEIHSIEKRRTTAELERERAEQMALNRTKSFIHQLTAIETPPHEKTRIRTMLAAEFESTGRWSKERMTQAQIDYAMEHADNESRRAFTMKLASGAGWDKPLEISDPHRPNRWVRVTIDELPIDQVRGLDNNGNAYYPFGKDFKVRYHETGESTYDFNGKLEHDEDFSSESQDVVRATSVSDFLRYQHETKAKPGTRPAAMPMAA